MKTFGFFTLSRWLLVLPLLTNAQSRNVDWIHGLGGSATSWEGVANTYNGQRQITGGARNSYETGDGIANFASAVQRNTGGANTIAISHSLGGTAVRQVDLWNASHWSGEITVGSPLRGAQIATSTRNGVAQGFINQGITELLRGPAWGSVSLIILGPTGILIRVAGILGTLYSNNIAGQIVNQIVNSLSLTDATAGDLNPTGNYMQQLTGQGTSSPKIQIWGREEDPIFWRLAGTFAGETDQWGVNLANDAAGVYNTAADIEFATSWIPPFILMHGYYNHRGHQWMAGANWLRETANNAWPFVIGAGYFVTQTIQVQEYDYANCGQTAQLCDPQNTTCDDSQCFYFVDRQVDIYYPDQSDGVVPAYSQRNDGGAWRGHIVDAPGVNHLEMLRFNEIQPTLDFVFNRSDPGIDQIFKIGQ